MLPLIVSSFVSLLSLLRTETDPPFSGEQQIGAKLPDFNDQLRPLEFGQVNFLHTTDTHAWYLGHLNQKQYSADWGDLISFTHHMREIAELQNQDLLVVDTGDKHDGNGLSDVTELNGNLSSQIFAKLDYDLLTIGNHELYVQDITVHEFENIVPIYGDRYICTNVEYIFENGSTVPFGSTHKLFHTPVQKLKTLALGVLFDFNLRQNKAAKVTPIKELVKLDWFHDLLSSQEDLDLIVIIGHLPVSHSWLEFQLLHDLIRAYFPNTAIQYFGGHSHIRDFVQLDDKSFGLQSGRYCETVGWLSIQDVHAPKLQVDRKYIDFNLHSFIHHSNTSSSDDFNTLPGLKTSQELSEIASELDLNKFYGTVPRSYYLTLSSMDSANNLNKFLADHILPLVKPASHLQQRGLAEAKITIVNTGSIRYDLYKGPFTRNSRYIVSPFKNKWKYIPSVPRHIALQIQKILNNRSYILSELESMQKGEISELFLLKLPRPELFYHESGTQTGGDNYFTFKSRSYGYVTHDDFGSDGDDTVHRAFPFYKEPNVIQSYTGDANAEYIDVIFYDFIEPHVLFALKDLDFDNHLESVYYNEDSENYNVGILLQKYVQENWN